MKVRYITQAEVEERIIKLKVYLEDYSASEVNRELYIYGVPRGGMLVAYYLSNSTTIFVTDDPTAADYIVDDLVDSGDTARKHSLRYPEKEFLVLFDKQKESIAEWLVFPWDVSLAQSAKDIPTRLLQYIGEDTEREGLRDTPARFLKAWKHYTSGYEKHPKDVLKEFKDGAENYNEMVLIKSIPVYSHCEHHMCPFYGIAHIAYIPDKKIVGLSKIPRLVDIFMRRLQVQERLTSQIASAIEEYLSPLGVAVVIECVHTCMVGRGVEIAGSSTVTSSMRGVFLDKPECRTEFMGLIK